MTVEEQREYLKKKASRLKEAGIEYEFFDYGLTLTAIIDKKCIPICRMYRPERDFYEGYILMIEKEFDAFIDKHRKVV